ncbi:nucleotidyltransferase domain-containing protein [Candidatus Aerophobetes bacterium]|nr:nucleotidyltransferase domain-containing protein [Candidatus Aerophobetes bacterium]
MTEKIPEKIKEEVARKVESEFKDNFLSLVLYGSCIKGRTRKYSDIDFIATLKEIEKNLTERIDRISRNIKRAVTLLPLEKTDFEAEKLPLFTAVKRKGIIVWGNVALVKNPQPPQVKYKDFFKKSLDFEMRKVKIAGDMLKNGLYSGVFALCFVAAKHVL